MIQMLFSLRYKAQLRRTRSALVSSLEESIAASIKASGGSVRLEQKSIAASFDESAVAFWLDLLCIVENLIRVLEGAASELYGHNCVIARNISEETMQLLHQMFPAVSGETGIWCATSVQKALAPYVVFGAPLNWTEDRPLVSGYAQIKSVKSWSPAAAPSMAGENPSGEKILRLLYNGGRRNTVLLGAEFTGKRANLYRFCTECLGSFPPLIIRFGAGGRGLSCLSDAYSQQIRAALGNTEELEALDTLAAHIFRERLRDTFSPYLIQKGRRFFHILLKSYISAAEGRKISPLIILENIHRADKTVREIFQDAYAALSYKEPDKSGSGPRAPSLDVYGTCADESCLRSWEGIFSHVIQFPETGHAVSRPETISGDLWEIACLCDLLWPYFPGSLFPQLIAEEGKNPRMLSRAFDLLIHTGIIDSLSDPRPRIHKFARKAGKALGDRMDRLRGMVRNRLLAWVAAGKLEPCFNLLKALSDLGGEGSDGLILDSIYGDLSNNTYAGIEAAIDRGIFGAIVGEPRVPALLSIFRTLKALIHGDEAAIREAFQEPYPGRISFPGYKAQIMTNLASFSLGKHDVAGAAEVIKESILLNQNVQGRGLAHAYRLFSLVNLAKQNLGDAIDYFTFAVENAEKAEDFDELAVCAYYMAGTLFLFGNLSRAERYARRAEEAASLSGRPEWTDRSRFLQGRFRFESGRYKEALGIFSALRENPSVPVSAEADRVLSAWIFRTNIYLRNDVRFSAEWNTDARLFEIEASYLAGDYRKTVELAEQMQAELPGQGFLFIEQPDWHSGFSQCELLLFPYQAFWERLVSAYQALALSRLGPGSNREQAMHIMERILRDERMPGTDPNDAFYFYAYYRILLEHGATEVDMNTAISLAFKRLQSRASRIDDIETRRVFLSQNYWNSMMGSAAKEHKLI
ncbi:MAG: tetratricopeptide repeat protein [Treponema sp.]|jgi:tetratricopeptide (TPR) repeat protein|nr:tetratricopeptide repeat protein [Treponema sp.]